MINLAITAIDHTDLHAKLKGILYGLAQAPAVVPTTISETAVEPAKPKLTKKQEAALKAAAEQTASTGSAAVLTTVEDEEVVLTKVELVAEVPALDDLRDALKTYAKAVFEKAIAAGKTQKEAQDAANDAGLSVLNNIAGTKPASNVPPEKRAAVIAEANRLLAEVTETTDTPTKEDLVAALNKLSSAEGHGTDAVFNLLASFKAKSSKDVPEDKRAEVIAAINAKLES